MRKATAITKRAAANSDSQIGRAIESTTHEAKAVG